MRRPFAVAVLFAAAVVAIAARAAADEAPQAHVVVGLRSAAGADLGSLDFDPVRVGVMLRTRLTGMPPGTYRMHVGAGDSCSPPPAGVKAAPETPVVFETVEGKTTDHLSVAANGTDEEKLLLRKGASMLDRAVTLTHEGDGASVCGVSPFPLVGGFGGRSADAAEARFVVEIAWVDPTLTWAGDVHPERAKTALDDHKCGGTLVSPDWVLTAAHCFDGQGGEAAYASQWVIRGGGVRILDTASSRVLSHDMQVFPIDKIIVHPDYAPAGPYAPPLNDLALVHLINPAPVNENDMTSRFAVLPLASRPYWPGEDVTAAGWGSEARATGEEQNARAEMLEHLTPANVGQASLAMARTLQVVKLTLLNSQGCAQAITDQIHLTGSAAAPPVSIPTPLVCAGDGGAAMAAQHQGTCTGDSGGALKTSFPSEMVAVVGWGFGCGQAPGVYTRITPEVVQWVTSQTGKLPPPHGKKLATGRAAPTAAAPPPR